MKVKIILIALMVITVLGCKKTPDNIIGGGFGFHFFSRKCNFMWADNIRGEIKKIGNHSAVDESPLKANSKVKYTEFILGISTCNVDIDSINIPNYQKKFLSENLNPLFESPYMVLSKSLSPMADNADPAIENKIKQFLATKYNTRSNLSSSLPKVNLEQVDYRTTPLKNIKITCSKDIFGIKAGEILNDYFVIHGYPLYHYFIVSSNKNLVSGKITNISLSRYLSYKPMAPAAMYMQFRKGLSIPANLTAEFTIELQLEGDKTISAKTKPISLTP